MSKKVALCRVSDTEPLMSLIPMLEYCGYECVLPDRGLRDYLRSIGCRNVDEFEDMRDRWGAEMPPNLPEVSSLGVVDLYVDVSAFHNGPLAWRDVPELKDKTLCYFINGGPPRNTPDKGDGITPACPVMTTNQWYATDTFQSKSWSDGSWVKQETKRGVWRDKSYVFYPMFTRWDRIVPRTPDFSGSPVCFCHNVMGWGYGDYVGEARKLGVKFYGGGNSPDGLVRHEDVFYKLAKAPCVVYLKGGGAVDYAVLEAMAMGVPVVVPCKYIDDTLTWPLLSAGTSILQGDILEELKYAVGIFKSPMINFSRGQEGKKAVNELCWQPERDGPGFAEWMGRQGFL